MKNSILITGASRGLGYALVEKYLEKGFYVYACMRNIRNVGCEKLQEKYKDSLFLISIDVSNTDSVKKAAAHVKEMTDHLDVIINNAAVHAEDSFNVLEEVEVDHCLEVYNINTVGALRVTKEFLTLLENGNTKVLANISSESGSIGDCRREKEFDYCMSKAALNMQSVQLQNYLKPKDIKVLAIHPGWIKTDMGGPNAHYHASEAATYISDVIDRLHDELDGPVFVDNTGNKLSF